MARPSRSARLQSFVDLTDKQVILAEEDEEAFRRILHFERELREWFQAHPGWPIERSREMIRLLRLPGAHGDWTGVLTGAGGRPAGVGDFREPLDYVLFTLVLRAAEQAGLRSRGAGALGPRFLLSELAGHLVEVVQTEPLGVSLDLTEISHRFALARVLRFLQRLGALACLDGSAEDWAERDSRDVDVLYAFTEVIFRLAPRLPSEHALATLQAEEPTPLRQEPLPELLPEQRAWRALLLGPALFAFDDPEAFAYVIGSRVAIGRELADVFGWRLDLYDGVARILRDSHAQDAGSVLLHCRRAEFGPILVLCDEIQEEVRTGALVPDAHGVVHVRESAISTRLLDIRQRHRDDLAAGLGTCRPQEFLDRVLGVMRAAGMARGPDRQGDLCLTPLCALYRGAYLESGGQQGGEAHAGELFAG